MLIEKIHKDELDMIDAWRRDYCYIDGSHHVNESFTPITSILHEWANSKSKYLIRLFDGNLIISKNIKYKKSADEMYDEFTDMCRKNNDKARSGYKFKHTWTEYFMNNYWDFTEEQRDGLSEIMSIQTLSTNIYDGPTFEVIDLNDRIIKVVHGCKVSKVLGKLASGFHIPGYEDFRICHSQILNQKELGGNLTLSIHPLDYMTMSDNTYDWDSCMSWVSEGCYRQGTVEMMNSPCVVVAYLAGNEEMKINGNSWNSKKWRELFIVNRDVITSIKDYPYNNESLTREIVKWIKELAEKNLGWTYTEPTDYDYNNHSFHLNHINSNIQLVFSTNNMYNDFGHIEKHYGCINNQLDRTKLFKKNSYDGFNSLCLEVEYSGASQCMVCGELDPEFDSGSCLACSDCQPVFRCTCCGDIITGEPVIVDEEILCEWCAENRVHECVGCGEIHYLDNVQPIYVIPRTNEEHEEVMKDAWKINHSYLDTNDSDIIGYIYKNDCHRAFICKNDGNNCIESFIEKYMNEGERPHHRSFEWYDECICVYFDQLNDSGREAFEVWNYENNEDFLDSFFNFNIYATTHIKHL